MAQRRGGQRGVANLVTCLILLLLGALGFTAGCSAGEDLEQEHAASSSEAQTLCNCPKPPSPCVQYSCVKTQCVLGAVKDGTTCQDTLDGSTFRGACLEGLCCPGCVVRGKLGTSTCAARGGTDPGQCGTSGEYCANCTADSCMTGKCTNRACVPVPEGEACTNAPGACHNGSCCQGCIDGNDQCVSGGSVEACGASSNGKLVKCKNCNDGDDCNGKDSCVAGACQDGTPPDCDDNEACTADSCSANGCEHTPLTGQPCNDGDPCTVDDKCNAQGKCAAGTPIKCDDGEFCTNDACKDGVCVNTPKADTTGCDDGNSCTSADQCASGKCKGTSVNGVDCDDDNVCTIDGQVTCTSTECVHTPAPSSVSCLADKCHEAGHCSGTDGTCVPGPEINCDDQNPCTKDSCEPDVGCVYTNDASADCSDGDPCTENDVCVKGTCGGKPKKCEPLDACHEAGSCDQNTGTCNDPRAADGKECPGGTCMNGSCILDPNANPGAGGEAAGGGGPGAGGETASGGAGATPGSGEGGQGDTSSEAGAGNGSPEEPERPFVRKPAGCSCDLPGSTGSERPMALMALALVAGVALRRSRRQRAAA